MSQPGVGPGAPGIDGLACGVLTVNASGIVCYANATVGSMLGRERGELIDAHIDSLLPVPSRIFFSTHLFPLLRVQRVAEEVYVPMRTADGTDLPMLLNGRARGDEPDLVFDLVIVPMRQRNVMESAIINARNAAQEAAAAKDEELRRDPMTGLLNDAGMQPQLVAAVDDSRRQGRRHALLFIDLDGFGELNKAYGTDVGDEVIRAVAERLAAAVRDSDAVGRQNRAGDEFIILLRDLANDEMAMDLAWRVHDSISRPVRVRGASLEVVVGASVGVAMVAPRGTESLEYLKRMADERMQAIKRTGGGVLGRARSRDGVGCQRER